MKMLLIRSTEIRRIPYPELTNIAKILNQPSTSPAWKKLMQIVPREMKHIENLSDDEQKYNFHHIRLIEDAVTTLRQPAAQIFLNEWITCGKIRPTLSHLLQLLIKSELYRAADYVATELLKEPAPQRPSTGPAARIDINLPEDDSVAEGASNVNGNCPNSSQIINLNQFHEPSKQIPNKELFDRTLTANAPISEEDLIRFSASVENNKATTPEAPESNDSSSIRLPNILRYLPHSSSHPPEASLTLSPALENNNSHQSAQQVQSSQSDSTDSEASHSIVVPNLSQLRQSSDSYSSNGIDDDNFPNLSALNIGIAADTHNSMEDQQNSEFIPHMSALM